MKFTKKSYESLQEAYNNAKENKEKSFIWEGHEFITQYAMYLLEYLTTEFIDNNQVSIVDC